MPAGINIEGGKEYSLLTVDLGIARTNELVRIIGDTMTVVAIDGELKVRIQEKDQPPIDLSKIRYVNLRPLGFDKLYFSNSAQTGKSCILLVGREASFTAETRRVGEVGILDSAEVRINPATEETLTGIKAQTDKLTFDADSNLNVNLQTTLVRKAELYDADETVAQEVNLDVKGFKLVEVYCQATTATTFYIDFSFDNVHWFNYYTSSTAETKYNETFWTGAQYIKVRSDPAGVAGDTVTLIISAKP